MSFKKILLWSFLVILAGGLSYGIYYASQAFPILAGYGAKNLCSCVTLGGRQPENVIKNELGGGILALGSFEFNASDSSATGSVFGFAKRKAVYRKGLGCTLLSEIDETELRNQKFNIAKAPAINQDSVLWPNGNLVKDTVMTDINYDKINKTIDDAFSEPGEDKNRR